MVLCWAQEILLGVVSAKRDIALHHSAAYLNGDRIHLFVFQFSFRFTGFTNSIQGGAALPIKKFVGFSFNM